MIRASVAALEDSAVTLRRELHADAELSTEEHRTQKVITDRLREVGVDDIRAIADTGLTCIIRGARPGPNILWRADIDGLPLMEETGLPFASTNGAMHACGHDGHAAIAVAVATLAHAARDRLAGTVRFAFQPAEERVGGAQRMIQQGVMDDPPVDQVFGFHLWASTPVGQALISPGSIFAAATHFRIIVSGRGGHAAAPHQTIDPIVVASHVVIALQTVVSRAIDPASTAVVTVGRIEGGVRGNIIPNEVMLTGTVRTFDAAVLDLVLRRMEEIVSGVTQAWRAEYRFDHSTLPAVVNDPEAAALAVRVTADMLGPGSIGEARATGADDMSYFLERAPGAYILLGAAPAGVDHVYPHHHPRFDFDEKAIALGVELALRVIEEATGSDLG